MRLSGYISTTQNPGSRLCSTNKQVKQLEDNYKLARFLANKSFENTPNCFCSSSSVLFLSAYTSLIAAPAHASYA